jgi:succinyl-diaminopimelate desuccinylase
MSINQIKGGNATNVIPDNCSISIDIRTLPGQPHRQIIDQFEDIFSKLKQQDENFDAKIELERSVPAMESDDNCPFIKRFCGITGVKNTSAAGYATDASFMTDLNGPIAIFGAGDAKICHKPNEYIEIADVEKGKRHFKKIIKAFLT